MNEKDKAAWLQACNECHANSGGKDLGEFMFQKGMTLRDKQAEQAEPVAFEDFRRKAYELFGWVSELGGYNDAIRELYEYVTHPAPAVVQGALRRIMEAHRFNVSTMPTTEVHAICFDALSRISTPPAVAQEPVVNGPVLFALWWDEHPDWFCDDYVSTYRDVVEHEFMPTVLGSPRIIELRPSMSTQPPAVAVNESRITIKDAQVDSSILSRAMKHPTVLEIIAECAEIIDTESSAVLGADYDGTALRATAKRFLEQAQKIRASDPEIWGDCPVAGLIHPAPAVAVNEPSLTGRWHHGNGVLVCGSIRIAQWDCDICPPKEFRDEVLDWMCETLNAAIAAAEALKGGVCKYSDCNHKDCGRFYDHNSRGMSCRALAFGACAAGYETQQSKGGV